MQRLTGGCFCGAIRYEIQGSLHSARACHCSRCRKAFSGASSAYAEVTQGSTLTWVGRENLASYESQAGWGMGFCKTCGSTLCGLHNGEVHGLTLGCIDGDPGVVIEKHIFVGSKAPWDHVGGSAPQYVEHAETESSSATDPKPATTSNPDER